MTHTHDNILDSAQLRQTVEKLHETLAKRWDMEGKKSECMFTHNTHQSPYTEENGQLKERITFMQSAAQQLEEVVMETQL